MNNIYFIFPSATDLNRGDQALVWESIALIKEIDINGTFFLLESGDNPEDIKKQTCQTTARGYNVLPRILRHPGRIDSGKPKKGNIKYNAITYLKWGYRSLFDFLSSSMLLSSLSPIRNLGLWFLNREQRQTYYQIAKCNAVFVKGGGFLHFYGKVFDIYLLYFLLFNLLLAIRLKKKIYILPNSIGPIRGFLAKHFVKKVLRHCNLVSVRENRSLLFVEDELLIPAQKFADLGYFIRKNEYNGRSYLENKNLPLGEKEIIGITLRPYRFPGSRNPGKKFNDYILEMSKFSDLVIESGRHILLYAHTLGPSAHEDDRIALRYLVGHIKNPTGVTYIEDFSHNCQDVMAIYENLDFMIGTRFHSVIFAQNVKVPSIAIAYGGNKSYGIMQDMGLGEYVIPIENIDGSKLYQMLIKLRENKLEYITKLDIYRKQINKERNLLIDEIRRTLYD